MALKIWANRYEERSRLKKVARFDQMTAAGHFGLENQPNGNKKEPQADRAWGSGFKSFLGLWTGRRGVGGTGAPAKSA